MMLLAQPASRLVLFAMDDVLRQDSRLARADPERKHDPGPRQDRWR